MEHTESDIIAGRKLLAALKPERKGQRLRHRYPIMYTGGPDDWQIFFKDSTHLQEIADASLQPKDGPPNIPELMDQMGWDRDLNEIGIKDRDRAYSTAKNFIHAVRVKNSFGPEYSTETLKKNLGLPRTAGSEHVIKRVDKDGKSKEIKVWVPGDEDRKAQRTDRGNHKYWMVTFPSMGGKEDTHYVLGNIFGNNYSLGTGRDNQVPVGAHEADLAAAEKFGVKLERCSFADTKQFTPGWGPRKPTPEIWPLKGDTLPERRAQSDIPGLTRAEVSALKDPSDLQGWKDAAKKWATANLLDPAVKAQAIADFDRQTSGPQVIMRALNYGEEFSSIPDAFRAVIKYSY